ncbi:MAG TPA: Si-specific NAD(P)(+) transhydrogenase [Candidatus Sulfotelmatobacter sp.]|nr:Si-specific NAD(P)(+) transhydrogenase [Candidatus Sulfotelmatobacter sp.]
MTARVVKLKPEGQGQAEAEAARQFDLLVIGSGPGGHRAAIQAAKLGKRVAVIERKRDVGGVCISSGTIPSKTFRETILHLSGYRERGVYGASYVVKQNVTMSDLIFRVDRVIRHEIDVVRHQLQRNKVVLVTASASFVDPHTVRLTYADGSASRDMTAQAIVIATGTSSALNPKLPFDGQHVFTSDDMLQLKQMPHRLAVIGGGVIGCEYATMFAALGVRVTLIDARERLLPFVDGEIVHSLVYQMQQNRVTMRLGEAVKEIQLNPEFRQRPVRIMLDSGKRIYVDQALYCVGRQGAVEGLGLEAAGVEVDSRGRITVNGTYQTSQPHIYAVGDVIGFPSLASTSMEQGRIAVCHAFSQKCDAMPGLFPYGIYTIPEISTVGRNEEELTKAGVPYEVGKAFYREIARGQILGDTTGLLKLLFHAETRELLGVHIIGEGASELVHIGQAVLAFNGTIDYFLNTVFNYPTFAECYKTAAYDGLNRLG